jgi:hypothetical protein
MRGFLRDTGEKAPEEKTRRVCPQAIYAMSAEIARKDHVFPALHLPAPLPAGATALALARRGPWEYQR